MVNRITRTYAAYKKAYPTFMKTKTIIALLTLSGIGLISCSNADTAKLIIGKWEFLKFHSDGKLTDEMKTDLTNFNSLNRGLTIRFSPSGEFESDQPGGSQENNSIADYKVLPGNKLLIEKDTLQVVEVNKTFLFLYKNEFSPQIIFRRLNSTGTEPGRR